MKLTLRDCGGTEAEMLPGEQAGGRTVGARELRLLRLTLSPPGTAGRAGAECDYPRWNEASVSHDTLLSVRSGNLSAHGLSPRSGLPPGLRRWDAF